MPLRAFAFAAALAVISTSVSADEVFQAPGAFLAEVFDEVPKPEVLWLTQSVRTDVERILGHRWSGLRIRYWRQGRRTAWILDEIGKERPITTGLVIDAGELERVKVLVYRESRGSEVRHPFFTDQFKGAALEPGRQLDREIHGISGATLSVAALEKLARLALYLHGVVHDR